MAHPDQAQVAAALPGTSRSLPGSVWAVGGAMAALILALSAALAWQSTKPAPSAAAAPAPTIALAPAASAPAMLAASSAAMPAVTVAAAPESQQPTEQTTHSPAPAPVKKVTRTRAPVEAQATTTPAVATTTVSSSGHASDRGQSAQSMPTTPAGWEYRPAQASSCVNCGTVDSVNAVQEKGQASGIGAVAGAVAGGLIGSQIGGGNGKKAATVIGAIGGGLAGHEIEKRQRGSTVYEVRVRMEDGSYRTVRQSQPIAVGTAVTVDGESLTVRSHNGTVL